MKWLRVAAARLRGLLRPDAVHHDIDEELRLHLEMETETNIERGMAPDEARRQALRNFGNVGRIKELAHEVRGGGMIETSLQDLRYAVRMLRKRPGFTTVAVLTLALGIGATMTVFSVLNAVLLRTLPFADADRLVLVWHTHPDIPRVEASMPDYEDWRRQAQSFEEMAVYTINRFQKPMLTGRGDPVQLRSSLVSQNFFSLLGLTPALGRTFTPEDEQPANNRVVILSRSLWQRSCGADPQIIGQSIELNGSSFTVVGVLSEQQYPLDADIWLPLSLLSYDDLTSRIHHPVVVIGRLKSDVTVERARTEMGTIARRLQELYPASNKTVGVELVPLRHQLLGNLRPAVLLIFAAVGLMLLIACANVSNLLLAQGAGRQKELALRAALGAGRNRLIRQLVTESSLLALLGGVAGLLLASWGVPLLRSSLPGMMPGNVPGLESIGVDWRTLGFTFGVSLVAGVLFGTLPALRTSQLDLNRALKEGAKGSAGVGRRDLNRALIVSEVALAVIVLVGAGLLVKSFQKLLRVDPGFRADNLLSLRIELPPSRYKEAEQVTSFYRRLMPRVEALPGVQQVTVVDRLPFAPSLAVTRFTAEGRQFETGKAPIAQVRAVDHRFFEVMHIPLLKGRLFDEADVVNRRDRIVINETLARRFFPDQDPVGKHLGSPDDQAVRLPIIGVVADIKDLGLGTPVEPEIYWPAVWHEAVLLVRTTTRGDLTSLAPAIRQAVLSTDPVQPMYQAKSVEEILSTSLTPKRFSVKLVGALALLALVLAAVGVYGVVAYSVTERTQEIGIRLALGAQKSDVLGLIISRGLIPVLLGIGVGLAGALALGRFTASLTEGLLFEVSASDPMIFMVISLLLLSIALLACYIPARRATKVDPLVVLRSE